MAERRTQYHTNGAAAYDVYTWNQSTAPQRRPEPQHLPEERPVPRKRQRVKARTALAPFTLFGMLAVACMLVLVVFGYVRLFETTSEVSKLETRLSELQSEQTLLRSKYEARIDLDAIEASAAELGLSKPTQEQIVYVDLSGTDRAEIYQEEKTSAVGEIIAAVEQSVSDLIAYLRPASA